MLGPGKLNNIGQPILSTGGAVSNTGLSLYKLGVTTELIGKVGNDHFGQIILSLLGALDERLIKNMIVSENEPSSYTIVISPPNEDRMFFHCAGVNDTFTIDDVDFDRLKGTDLFHFGYPPLMKMMYMDEGIQLAELFKKVKEMGITTSLDIAQPDPNSDSGKANWKAILQKVLPYVDIFHPSLDEILFMIKKESYGQIKNSTNQFQYINSNLLKEIAEELLEMGTGVVNLKLGSNGLYVRTSQHPSRLQNMGKCTPKDFIFWVNRELFSPCYKVQNEGTTGAGDATIAGFLTALLHEYPIEKIVKSAVAVGALSVEKTDSISGIQSWEIVIQRMNKGWDLLETNVKLTNWSFQNKNKIWIGPNDQYLKEVFYDNA
jgi:sugar/nucleoside kinase (ribokinase family)